MRVVVINARNGGTMTEMCLPVLDVLMFVIFVKFLRVIEL